MNDPLNMTFGDMQEELGYLLREQKGYESFWSATERKSWLNQGMFHTIRLTDCLSSTLSISTIDGTRAYTLSPSTGSFIRLDPDNNPTYEDTDGNITTLKPRILVYWDDYDGGWRDSSSTGTPTECAVDIKTKTIYLKVTPDFDGTSNLVIPYIRGPVACTLDTEYPEVSNEARLAAIVWAHWRCARKSKEYVIAKEIYNDFLVQIGEIIGNNKVGDKVLHEIRSDRYL